MGFPQNPLASLAPVAVEMDDLRVPAFRPVDLPVERRIGSGFFGPGVLHVYQSTSHGSGVRTARNQAASPPLHTHLASKNFVVPGRKTACI